MYFPPAPLFKSKSSFLIACRCRRIFTCYENDVCNRGTCFFGSCPAKENIFPAGALIDVNGAFVIPLRRLFVRIIQKIQSGNRLYVTLNLF